MHTGSCPTCRSNGGNWVYCTNCNRPICRNCASKGVGGYPKTPAVNHCPFCGKIGSIKPASSIR